MTEQRWEEELASWNELNKSFNAEMGRVRATRRLVWVLLWVCGMNLALAAVMAWMWPVC